MPVRKILSHTSDSCTNGKLITLAIPSFSTIHQLFLEFTNAGAPATLADIISSISNVSLIMNGEEYVNASPADLAKCYEMLGAQVGLSTPVNVLPLLIPQLMYKLPAAEDSFAIGCDGFTYQNGQYQPLTNIQIQIRCGATVSNVSDVKAYSERTEKPFGQNITAITCKLLSYAQSFTTTGISEVDTLPRDSNMGRLFTLAIPDATGVISSGEALVNNQPVVQNVSIATNNLLVGQRGFAPVSGVYNYSFTDGGTNDVLSMQGVTDMRFKTTFTTAPTTGYTLLDATVRSVRPVA